MILIADSGSTKTSWIAINEFGKTLFEIESKGLNPTVFPKEILKERIVSEKDLYQNRNEVKKIFFYGAGCGSTSGVRYLKQVFKGIFINAIAEIYKDTLGAVNSLHIKSSGMVCILGTGSNCCFYDGEKTHQKITSLGYSIMDDASGNYFGRQLIRDYYHLKMPADLAQKFESEYDLNADVIKENLYKKENPNTYLAKFARFLIENKASPYAKKVIVTGLRSFTENQILPYKESRSIPIYFIGSIAYFLKNEIEIVFKEFDLKLGKIVRQPIRSLAKYHSLKK